MNFITTNHQGGLCNVMFKLSAAISLSLDVGVDYVFSNEFIRQLDKDVVCDGFDDYRIYYDNVLRGINFIDKLPETYRVHHDNYTFNYKPIAYRKGENLLLEGYFQSEKYFINNKDYIINLFKPTENIKQTILEKIPNINKFISIHVRRGDYLNLPDFHPIQPLDYYKSSVNMFGIENTYLIFSDGLDEIRDMFDFIPNKQFVTLGKDYLDLYAMSMCEHNIICNSTFGWWGAYLNENKNKKIIAPRLWFGPSLGHLNTSDLIPNDWIKI
jgi:hypothetical protein